MDIIETAAAATQGAAELGLDPAAFGNSLPLMMIAGLMFFVRRSITEIDEVSERVRHLEITLAAIAAKLGVAIEDDRK